MRTLNRAEARNVLVDLVGNEVQDRGAQALLNCRAGGTVVRPFPFMKTGFIH